MNEPSSKWDRAVNRLKAILSTGKVLCLASSTGKDSTACTILFLEALKQLKEEGVRTQRCYIINSDTRLDMPFLNQYVEGEFQKLRLYCARNELNVEVVRIEPPHTARFSWTCLARGKLPSFPGVNRDCSTDLKVKPMQNHIKQLEKDYGTKIISVTGVRFDESAQRAKSMNKYLMDEITVSEVDGNLTYAAIADWDVDDVWEFLVGCSEHENKPVKIFKTYSKDFDQLFKLYRDANEGTCAVIVGNNSNVSACGSRFGCAICPASGNRDKSLESLIAEDSDLYGFMSGFLDLRNWLFSIRWDLTRRDWRGRAVSKAGYVKVTPDYWSPHTKRELLRFMITLDQLELERAQKMEVLWYENKIEHNEVNFLLTSPMFEMITYDDILLIDFQWSLSRDFPNEASPAAKDYIDIRDLNIKYHIPVIPEFPRVKIPNVRWFDTNPAIDDGSNPLGLRGMVNASKVRNINIHYSDKLKVESGGGWSYIDAVRSLYYDLHLVDSKEVCRSFLDNGWLSIRRADLERYENIALRHDYINRSFMNERPTKISNEGETQLMSVHEYLLENSISSEEHKAKLLELKRDVLDQEPQFDILGADSIINAFSENDAAYKKEKKCASDRVITHTIGEFETIASQIDAFGY